MARVYIVTEEEMISLVESLELEKLRAAGHFRGSNPEQEQIRSDMHRTFHMVAVRWVQAMGFKGYRS
jgi:hypothetical protein